jgi:reverse gyrase
MDPTRMQEIQETGEFAEVLGKIISGKPGYMPVIEKKPEVKRCRNCGEILLINNQKFCHECGAKIIPLEIEG